MLNQRYIEKLTHILPQFFIFFYTKCTLKCLYCSNKMYVSQQQSRHSALERMGLDKYVENILKLTEPYKPVNMIFGGPGEPSESPFLYKLSKPLLDAGHNLRIMTNLNESAKIEKILREYPSKRISFVISYHLGTFLDRENGSKLRETFLKEHYPRIVQYAPEIIVITPMTPKAIFDENIVADYEYMRKIHPDSSKFKSYVTEMGSLYKNNKYPASYTYEERVKLYKVMNEVKTYRHHPSDHESLKGVSSGLKLKGKLCWVSMKLAQTALDGTLFRCQLLRGSILGNLDNPDKISLYTEKPISCPLSECNCKAMGYTYCLFPNGMTISNYYSGVPESLNELEMDPIFT